MGDSYPQPRPPYNFSKLTTPPRDLVPVYPPEESLVYPELPTALRLGPSFDAPYRLSTHIIPSAYLRTSWNAPVPTILDAGTKEERMKMLEKVFRMIVDNCTTCPTQKGSSSNGHPKILFNCLNRYVRKGLDESSSTGVTLFFAHATGFPKEIWEPTLGYLLSCKDVTSMVDEIWAWEAVHHGDAGVINAASLPGTTDWTDNTRDIINFLINYMPKSSWSNAILPTHLPRISSEETKTRLLRGFDGRRKIVVIGHSFGGCTSALAACIYPVLFNSLILVDPVIIEPNDLGQLNKTDKLAFTSLTRRETWPSKTEALKSFQSNPFFNNWDSSVLELYVQHATYDTIDASGKPVTRLKMAPIQECISFRCDGITPQETFERLHTLDERIRLRWVVPGMPGREDSIGGTGNTERRVWVRLKNASNVKIKAAGHLIPMEAPKELAQEIKQHLFGIFASPKSAKSNL